jgi:beta-galactosidase
MAAILRLCGTYMIWIINNKLRIIASLLITISLTFIFTDQTGIFAQIPDNPLESVMNFFSKKDLMKIGVYYYPEQWPKEQWERDLQNMAKYGFEFTHFAEFAWTFLEPEEGKFDFKWLDEAISLANKAGLKVILCTPTPCPPAWMGEKYPEIYLVDLDGHRLGHGTRANVSLSNQRYKDFVERIVTELAKRYGDDERIWGWQLDNEPQAVPDYSPSARQAFQKWLQKRYVTINKLNEVWVGSFWSTRYDNFEQVLIPNAAMNGEDKLSPHALLDFQHFTADVTADFLNHQAEILRRYIRKEQWITTNYVNVSTLADPRRSDKIDFPTFTMYPVAGKNILGGNSFRLGNPIRLAEACDYYRPIKGVTGAMELQPGQVNWASINPQVFPGAIRMWILHAFGGRCSFVCTYRYRHPVGSSEMYHDGIVGTDGVTLSRGGEEFIQAIRDIKTLRLKYNSHATLPEIFAKRKTGFLWSHENMWDLDIQPQTELWNTWRHRNIYTAAVKSTAAPMDFISENDDFSVYPFLIAPAYQLVNPNLVKKWHDYVEKGGHLILSCRTAQKDTNGHFFEAKLSSSISDLIGADLDFFDMLLPDGNGEVIENGRSFSWNCWADVLTPRQETEVLAKYTDQFYAGKAAAVTRKLGKGTVTYIGVETKEGALEREIVRGVYERAGVGIENLSRGMYLEWRDGFFVAVNYSNETINFPVPARSKILIGENPLVPGQALVWML